jgi:hypothetical protein
MASPMYYITELYDTLYGNPANYLYAMTIYHILIPFWVMSFAFDQAHTFITLNPTNFGQTSNIMNFISLQKGFYAIIWALLIVSLDFIFLLAVKFHFKLTKININFSKHKNPHRVNFLTYTNIAILEVIIFIVSFYSVSLREVMIFLSINTIQITIAYYLITKIPFSLGKILFTTAAYIFIIKLLIFPIYH